MVGERRAWDMAVKKFGNPPPGSRVYIQTRQVVDGQQDLPVANRRGCAGPAAAPPSHRRGRIETREIYRRYKGDLREIHRNEALTPRCLLQGTARVAEGPLRVTRAKSGGTLECPRGNRQGSRVGLPRDRLAAAAKEASGTVYRYHESILDARSRSGPSRPSA